VNADTTRIEELLEAFLEELLKELSEQRSSRPEGPTDSERAYIARLNASAEESARLAGAASERACLVDAENAELRAQVDVFRAQRDAAERRAGALLEELNGHIYAEEEVPTLLEDKTVELRSAVGFLDLARQDLEISRRRAAGLALTRDKAIDARADALAARTALARELAEVEGALLAANNELAELRAWKRERLEELGGQDTVKRLLETRYFKIKELTSDLYLSREREQGLSDELKSARARIAAQVATIVKLGAALEHDGPPADEGAATAVPPGTNKDEG